MDANYEIRRKKMPDHKMQLKFLVQLFPLTMAVCYIFIIKLILSKLYCKVYNVVCLWAGKAVGITVFINSKDLEVLVHEASNNLIVLWTFCAQNAQIYNGLNENGKCRKLGL